MLGYSVGLGALLKKQQKKNKNLHLSAQLHSRDVRFTQTDKATSPSTEFNGILWICSSFTLMTSITFMT